MPACLPASPADHTPPLRRNTVASSRVELLLRNEPPETQTGAELRPTTIYLRAHHLLCMLTFAGVGYSPEFVANFRLIVARIERSVPVKLVAGPDDICAALQCDSGPKHCANASVVRRDRIARKALRPVVALATILEGGVAAIDAAVVAELRAHFATGAIRTACSGCEWFGLCTSIAARNFSATALFAANADELHSDGQSPPLLNMRAK